MIDCFHSSLQESKREERKKLADEDALRKIKQLEEQKYELQKQVANQKPADGSWPGHYGTRPFVGSPVSKAYLPNHSSHHVVFSLFYSCFIFIYRVSI